MGGPDRPDLADTMAGWSGGGVETEILPRGSALGRYLVLEQRGAGGMGVVYSAYDPELDRKVAIKLVRHDPTATGGSDGRARMLREAQAIARLSHPNVITVHDVGIALDQVFVAMELVDGLTVTAWLAERPRELPEILDVFVQAARGLAAAHVAGLVHRDVKPDNILVGNDGRTRVVDFGLVRDVNAARPEADPGSSQGHTIPTTAGFRMLNVPLTQVGAFMGTPDYMAPEQFAGAATDARTDQYGFCASLYQALHGKPPFATGSVLTSAQRAMEGGPLPEPNAKVPAHVRAVVRRGLSPDPAARFASMAEVIAELQRDPDARRRRPWLAVAAAVAVVGAGAGVAVPLLIRGDEAAASPCGGAEERLAGAWDDGRRAAVERAFAATKAPFAADATRSVTKALDDYAAGWTRSYQDSCEATVVRGEQSAEMQDLRATCLAQRRGELDALVDLLAEADTALVQRALTAAQSLPPVDACDDLAALKAPVPPPAGEEARRAVAALRDELVRTQALLLAGRNKEGLAQAQVLRERARALGYRPLQAQTGGLLSQLQSRSGDPQGALVTLREAFAEAVAGRDDENVSRITVSLVQATTGVRQFDRAAEWSDIAQAALERIGDPPARRAALHVARGHLMSGQGRMADAVTEQEAALGIRQKLDPDSLETARTLNNLAFLYDELGRYAEARAAGERSLAIQRAGLGPSHPDVALVLNHLGNIASDEGDLTLAIDYYKRSLAIREKSVAAGDDPSSLASVLNNLGVAAFDQERLDEALAWQQRALALREEQDPASEDVSMSLVNIGAILERQQKTREALATFERARDIGVKAVGADHPYVGDALEGIGGCTRQLGRFEESQRALEHAQKIRAAGARPIEVATVDASLAQTLYARGQKKRALELARKARGVLAADPAAKRHLAELDAWLAGK
ncbi:MAG TPA: serine/threonine-protein kinase [Kofleriaceae bacterium]|nr:serine/threonine-protein kinase [Kofleriaceae bacterium]